MGRGFLFWGIQGGNADRADLTDGRGSGMEQVYMDDKTRKDARGRSGTTRKMRAGFLFRGDEGPRIPNRSALRTGMGRGTRDESGSGWNHSQDASGARMLQRTCMWVGWSPPNRTNEGKTLARAHRAASRWRELLLSIAQLPMDEQRAKSLSFHDTYHGNNEQIDDICVIGVRV